MSVIYRPLLATCVLLPMVVAVSSAADVDVYGDPLPPGAVARLGTTRLGCAGDITFSPDGTSLRSGHRVWDTSNGKLMKETVVWGGLLSPDGRTAVRGGRRDKLELLEAATGRLLYRLDGHKSLGGHFFTGGDAFLPDGKILATGGCDGVIRLWDVTTGKEVRTLDNPGRIDFLACIPDGKTLVSITEDVSTEHSMPRECRLLDVDTGKVLRRWENVVKPWVLSADGKTLALGAEGAQMRLWDVPTGKELRQFDLPKEKYMGWQSWAANSAALSKDGQLLAVGDLTNRVRVLDVGTGKELYCSPPLKCFSVGPLAFSPDGKTLAVEVNSRILLWEAATGKDLLPLGGHTDSVYRVAFAPDGKTIATDSLNEVILWDPLTGRERQRHTDARCLLAFAPDGSLILEDKGSVVQCEPATGKELRSWKQYGLLSWHYPKKLVVAFSLDGKMMASGSEASGGNDRTVRLRDLDTGKILWHAQAPHIPERSHGGWTHYPLGFTHDGTALVTFGDDRIVHLWDIKTGKESSRFSVRSDWAVLSPDGRFLVAADGTYDHLPRLWILTTGQEPRPILFSQNAARKPTFSPDGSVVAWSEGGPGEDAEIVLLERASAREIRRLKGHEGGVNHLAFAPDGRSLVSCGHDLTALVWDVTGLMRDGRLPESRLDAEELEAAWKDLADPNAAKAHRALWKLVAVPRQAVPLLADRLKPVAGPEPATLAKLIGDVGDEDSAVREKAMKDLEDIGELAESAMQEALKQKLASVVQFRLKTLLERLDRPVTDVEQLRALRAVSVLGQVASPDARKVLDAVAKGAPESSVTKEATAAGKRLAAGADLPR